MDERVILVDENDKELGTEEKLAVHESGKLHRAFSVFVFDRQGNMLLQRRAATKYHSGGLWSNACCGHPRPGESTEDAAHRRLREEMGFDCRSRRVASFTYRADLDHNLLEHEYDHILLGCFDGTPVPAAEEVDEWCWVSVDDVVADLGANPRKYTAWFPIALENLATWAGSQEGPTNECVQALRCAGRILPSSRG